MKKIALPLLLIALCLLLCSCTSLGSVYPNAEKYTAGGTSISKRVEDIDINWGDGMVNVAYHEGDEIILKETADKKLSKDLELHWYLDGKELKVQYAASGIRTLPNLDKELTVLLPAGLELDDVKINVASAEVQADGIEADEINVNTASGRVALRQAGHAEKVAVNSASGDVAVAIADADTLKINTVSGKVVADVYQADEVKGTSASGAVVMQFAHMPDQIDVDSVSGNVDFLLPANGGFTASVDSLSGSVRGNLDMKKLNDDKYVYGNGDCRISVDTVSGNVRFDENTAAGEKEI
ncbi:MAG: DUF4097 domain-containing protein [Clostridiales bacterium]|nr:DUF4097 domain-containing protein [Clostridiales bacterium]